MKLVLDWELALYGETADGFFKVIIKKEPQSTCWPWALEWNKNYRIIGLFGNKECIESFDSLLCEPNVKRVGNFTYRRQIPLSENEDILFKLQA